VAAAAQVSAAIFTAVMAKRTHDLATKTEDMVTAANKEAEAVVTQGEVLERQAKAMAELAEEARNERSDQLQAELETSFLRTSEQARKISSFTTGGGGAPAVLNVINASDVQVIVFEGVAIIEDYPTRGVSWRGSFLELKLPKRG
jgi:hypothetical protein